MASSTSIPATFHCPSCARFFDTKRGLSTHQAVHTRQLRQTTPIPSTSAVTNTSPASTTLPTSSVTSSASSTLAVNVDVNSDVNVQGIPALSAGSTVQVDAASNSIPTGHHIKPNLPSFTPVNPIPTQDYNNVSGAEFAASINAIYEEIITWRKNLFLLPSGQHGRRMIKLLSEWLALYNNDTSFQGIALKVFMVLPALMLQKPSAKSKARDHTKALSHRLDLWQEGNLLDLLREGKIIQGKLASTKRRTTEDVTRIFSKLMLLGKVSDALKYLDESSQNGVLPPTKEVVDLL